MSFELFSFRCEAFPTYPRTYDLVHAEGLLSLQIGQQRRCTMLDLFSEIDRLLRPEVPFSFVLLSMFHFFIDNSDLFVFDNLLKVKAIFGR